MKTFRKLTALVLVVMMLASCLSVGANAVLVGGDTPYVPVDEDVLPTIIVPGLFQSETKYYDENGNVALDANGNEYAMPFFLDTTNEIVGAALEDALDPLVDMLISQEDKEQRAAHAVADLLCETLMGKQKLDENGRFINDIRATEYKSSYALLSEHDQETIFDHFPLEYFTKHAGEDKLYVFSYPSLDNMIDIAERLDDFIQFVKEDSGYDKVNIVPISQGGSVFVALMQIYADEGRSLADDFNKIVFAVPALNGSTLVGEILEYGLVDDDKAIYRDLIPALLGEDNMLSYLINIVLRFFPNADLNNLLDIVFDTFISEYAGYSTALWGLCPAENYPGARERYLTDECMASIAEQTDWFYNAQLNYKDNILKAVDEGVQIFDIVDYNVPLYPLVDSAATIPADGIIQLDSTSMGAYGVNNNVELPEDYVPTHSNCTDPENHDHSDPHNLIDVCTGLLPETTFYFYGQSHESSASNDVLMKLACSIVMDSNFTSVHSYPNVFPQFNGARNVKGFMKDIQKMKEYDTSHLPEKYVVELEGAIAQAEAMLENTIIDNNEVSAAKVRFYNICDRIETYEETDGETDYVVPETNSAYLDFSYLLGDILYILSELFYILFGGNGFSDL